MPRCDGCGAHVSTQFLRVFGTNDGDLQGCPNCMSNTDLFDGGTVPAAETGE